MSNFYSYIRYPKVVWIKLKVVSFIKYKISSTFGKRNVKVVTQSLFLINKMVIY